MVRLCRGNKNDFKAENILPGEFALCLDTKELVFCFEKGKPEFLKISEEVNKETAEKLIDSVVDYIQLSMNKRA